MPIEIYSADYASKRAEEIQQIEKDIAQQKKNKMLFQTLPFHKRRRVASFDERRLPKEYRRGEKHKRRARNQTIKNTEHTLKAHTWYAKRFRMHKSKNTPLPLERTQKSSKFIKSALGTRGVLSDISYARVYLIKEPVLQPETAHVLYGKRQAEAEPSVPRQAEAEAEPSVPSVPSEGGERVERVGRLIVYAGSTESIVVSEDEEYVFEEFSKYSIERVPGLSVFQVFGEQSLFSTTEYRDCSSLAELGGSAQPRAQKTLPHVVVRYSDKASLVLVPREKTMLVLQKAVVSGIVPCSVLELFRVGVEYGCAVYPFDFTSTERGEDLVCTLRQEEREKTERKPKGKQAVVFSPLFVPGSGVCTESSFVPVLFTARKGVFPEGSPVALSEKTEDFEMTGAEVLVGEVLRSAFSFTRGRTAGVANVRSTLEIPQGQSLFIRNLRTKTFRKVEHTVADPFKDPSKII